MLVGRAGVALLMERYSVILLLILLLLCLLLLPLLLHGLRVGSALRGVGSRVHATSELVRLADTDRVVSLHVFLAELDLGVRCLQLVGC